MNEVYNNPEECNHYPKLYYDGGHESIFCKRCGIEMTKADWKKYGEEL